MTERKRNFERGCRNRHPLYAFVLVFAILLQLLPIQSFAADVTYQNTFSLAVQDDCGATQIGTMTWTDTDNTEVQNIPVFFVRLPDGYDSVKFGTFLKKSGLFVLSPIGTKYTNVADEDKVKANTAFGTDSSYYDKGKALYASAEASITFTEQLTEQEDCSYLGFFWPTGHILGLV